MQAPSDDDLNFKKHEERAFLRMGEGSYAV